VNSTPRLACDLYQQVRSGSAGNLLVSPYSVWLALAMLYPGARGKAHDALGAALGITGVDDVRALGAELATRAEPDAYQRRMIDGGYQKADSYGFHLAVANKLWVHTGYRIKPEYGAALASAFGVDPAPVDFADGARAAAAINRWCDDQTRGRIKDIVDPSMISPPLRAILANAIYFKAGWAAEFHKGATLNAPFYKLDGSTAQAAFMRRTAHYHHATVDGADVIDLPYIQPAVSMVVIAPARGRFEQAERGVSAAWLQGAMKALAGKRVALSMPRFKFDTSLIIGTALRQIGFAAGMNGDLSGISDEPGFAVGDVIHKTFIAVDEQGTEAAAVTAMMLAGAAPMREPDPIVVTIDRPFYVVIRDEPTGTVLFFGRVVAP
jgi:serpin B